MIRYIYTLFLGIFLAIFVGMGIAVFYEAPASPPEPGWYGTYQSKEPTSDEREVEQKYIKARDEYDKKMFHYNRNVSAIVLTCAVIVLILSLTLSEKLGTLADGILLGGIFTLLYGIGRGMATDSNKYRFLVATIGLATTLFFGYLKFTRSEKRKSE